LAFMSIGSLVPFYFFYFLNSFWKKINFLILILDSSSLVTDPHFILFLNFYPRNQEVAS
jgi:hypothetical protein